jgi:hypothetical protein
MPFCQDQECGKTNLRKHEVRFDEDQRKVLCRPCWEKHHHPIPVEVVGVVEPKREFDLGVFFTIEDGLQIEARYGGIEGEVRLPIEEIKRIFGK